MPQVKRPSLRRYPKRPKASASVDSWRNYDQRCRDAEKANGQKMSDYNKKVSSINSAKKQREGIIKRTKGLSGIALGKRSSKRR
jgi:hypothetical protein